MVKYLIGFLQKTNLLNNQLRPKTQSFYYEIFKIEAGFSLNECLP